MAGGAESIIRGVSSITADHFFALALAEADQWADQFLGLDQIQRFVVILVAIGCLTGLVITLVSVIAVTVAKAHQRRFEAELKQDLLDRGLSVEELVQVIEATPPDKAASYLNAIFGCKK